MSWGTRASRFYRYERQFTDSETGDLDTWLIRCRDQQIFTRDQDVVVGYCDHVHPAGVDLQP